MLDAGLKDQLKAYLGNLRQQIELVASLGEGQGSKDMLALLEDVAAASDKVSLNLAGDDARKPSFAIERDAKDSPQDKVGVRFAGLPLGHEFTSLVLALLHVGGHPPKFDAEVLDQVRALEGPFRFETYFSQSCQNCPDVVQALNTMAALNPNITHVAIDGALFQQEVEARQVMAVPTVLLNGQPFGQGRMSLEQIVAKLDTGAVAREAEKIKAKDAFEVLIVGGGPAGAAAAIYAARKGIRVGVAAERFGGQVLDTMAIENFISVSHTEGPRLVAGLEQHVKDYDADIMNLQKAVGLVPAQTPGGLIEIRLENGASLTSRSVILATGARWRNVNVPGEAEYKNKGVAYCPHCDGPLFKGKRVAVIGGGNSGVEAAIDLAGIVAHVTLIEFDSQLRADAVLQRKLASLPNVKIVTSAMTTEIHGDGTRVSGLTYKDRNHDSAHRVDLEGVFVQIGLVPNTEWLKDSGVALSNRGEIEVDYRGETSLPGVFAAGDATTTPYKQIVIAMGEGSKSALSAFDYLIRLEPAVPAQSAAA
ncbi:alkyl hydroperoxide reductase subunit F [Caulobacter sp. DWR3-1-2]|uniref:alkyl hydroperoxide reductase subunit F n=1 Tax=Caulobacter sp. DWR3-1-2 TaxID=2804647 RepID=UPI003CF90293